MSDSGDTRKGPTFYRVTALIDALNAEAGPNRVLHGALQAALIAQANDEDARRDNPIEVMGIASRVG